MSKKGQQYLVSEIKRAIEYCIDEYNMTWAEAVGCIYMTLHYVTNVSMDDTDEGDAIDDGIEEDDEDDEDDDDDEGEGWKRGITNDTN